MAKLQVLGGASFSGNVYCNSLEVGTSLGLTVNGNITSLGEVIPKYNGVYGATLGAYGATNGAGLNLTSSNVAGIYSAISFTQYNVSGNGGLIYYEISSTSTNFRTNGSATDRLTINSAGKYRNRNYNTYKQITRGR